MSPFEIYKFPKKQIACIYISPILMASNGYVNSIVGWDAKEIGSARRRQDRRQSSRNGECAHCGGSRHDTSV